jgi:hypothetical protein
VKGRRRQRGEDGERKREWKKRAEKQLGREKENWGKRG